MPSTGLPGRLTRGAGTHLASWLQEVGNVDANEAALWLANPRNPRTAVALSELQQRHGRTAGHSGPIVDAALSGELLATKDAKSMRLWRTVMERCCESSVVVAEQQ